MKLLQYTVMLAFLVALAFIIYVGMPVAFGDDPAKAPIAMMLVMIAVPVCIAAIAMTPMAFSNFRKDTP